MKILNVRCSCPPLPDLPTVQENVIIQAGSNYGGNLPRPGPFLVYEFAVYALVPGDRVRRWYHRQITLLHLGSDRSALYIRNLTGTMMLPEFVLFGKSVSLPRYSPPSVFAVCDEVVYASMLKEVAAIQFRDHWVDHWAYISAKQLSKEGGATRQPGKRSRALQPECRLHLLIPALDPGSAKLYQGFVNPPTQPFHCSLCPSVVGRCVVDRHR